VIREPGNAELNLSVFRDKRTVNTYARYQDLQPCEAFLFDKYLRPRMRILDLGVGAGRTAPVLAAGAASYVGVDYSPEMIDVCRSRYPSLVFQIADAVDLSEFSDGSFDLVVFAFNGLDYLYPDSARRSCIREICRVLERGGLFICSVHNALCVFPRSDNEVARIRADYLTSKVSPNWTSAQRACSKAVSAILRMKSNTSLAYGNIRHKLFSRVFWKGEGYFYDRTHGGLFTRAAIPHKVRAEMAQFNLEGIDTVKCEFPQESGLFSTAWFYYVFRKQVPMEGHCTNYRSSGKAGRLRSDGSYSELEHRGNGQSEWANDFIRPARTRL